MATGLRVVIADDQPLYRAGIRTVLADLPEFQVVGEVDGGPAVLEVARRTRPDLLVLGHSPPALDGIRATRLLREELPETRVLLLSAREDVREALEALAAGAQGYLFKGVAPEGLIDALRQAAAGELVLGSGLLRAIFQELLTGRQGNISGCPTTKVRLTRRELEVLRLIARGRTNRQAAAELGISENTVKNHLRSVLAKLNLSRRREAVRYARELGLIEEGPTGR